MTNIFFNILGMSLTASYCIILVCIIRLFLRKAPKIYSYCLWSVVLFRLICPVSLASPVSLMSAEVSTISEKLSNRGVRQDSEDLLYNNSSYHNNNSSYGDTDDTTYLINTDDDISYGTDSDITDRHNHTEKVTTHKPEESSGAVHNIMSDNLTDALKFLWLLGIMIICIYSISMYIHLKIKLNRNSEYMMKYKDITVYEVRGLSSPFVMGMIKPSIYLSNDLDDSQREICLVHEYTHIKRYDHLIKMLAFITVCIHWFNPLVWLFFKLMTSDMEMSCDEMALRGAGIDERKAYSKVLLSLSTDRNYGFSVCPLAFAEDNSKSRIKNILNYKKPAVWAASICVIIVIICVIGLSVNPQANDLPKETTQADNTEENIPVEHMGTAASDNTAYFISEKTTDPSNNDAAASSKLLSEEQLVSELMANISSIEKEIDIKAASLDTITEDLYLAEEKLADTPAGTSQTDYLETQNQELEASYIKLEKQMLEEEILALEQELNDIEKMLDNYDSYLKEHYIYSGTYIMKTTDNNDNRLKPSITIHTYNQSFSLETGDILSSFYPYGSYSISDDKLICTATDSDYIYVFRIIDKDQLQFISDESYIPEIIDKEHSLEITDDTVFINSGEGMQ